MSKRTKLFIWIGVAVGVIALVIKPIIRITYLWFSFLSIMFGGDVYDILEAERYQSYYPLEVEISTETMEINGETFFATVKEESIKNIFHLDPWGSSNQFVLNSILSIENKDNVALEVDIPFNHYFLRDIADEASDMKSKSSDDLMLVWKGYGFTFDFNEENVIVEAIDEY